MSYISAVRKRKRGSDQIYLYKRNDQGQRIIDVIDTKNYLYFYIRDDKNGTYTGIHGEKLSKISFNNTYEYHKAKDQYAEEGILLYESDIPPELKYLSHHYFGAEAPFLKITHYDIEVDYDIEIGFSKVENPYAPISSVSLYHEWTKRLVVIAVPPKGQQWDEKTLIEKMNEVEPIPTEYNLDIYIVENEMELLLLFLDEIQESDGISGWNSEFFDTPYVCKRIEKVLGTTFLKKMSFEGAELPIYQEVETKFGNKQLKVVLSGRMDIDYKELYRKYEQEEKRSYSLEAVSNDILPDLPKLEYEGSLHSLYRNNFPFFIRYNIRDVECLHGFEKKLGYIELANQMYHISTGLFQYVTGTLKLSDLAIINYCHRKYNLIVPDWTEKTKRKAEGAYVLVPQVGLHEWMGGIDINSLYPSAIRAINISPETLIGQFVDEVKAADALAHDVEKELTFEYDHNNEVVKKTTSEWKELFRKNRWAYSGFGTVFKQDKEGIIPSVLNDWYDQRKKYKKLSAQAEERGEKDKHIYFDKLQYVYKIKLNSLYGALLNYHFRFYDYRMGESTTGTGRMILRHQCAKVCEILDGVYQIPDKKVIDKKGKEHWGYNDKWSVAYGDTDSTYFTIPATDKEEAIQIADAVGEKVNESFPEFMRKTFLCNDGFDKLIVTGRELVSKRSIFIDKKRYILHVVDKEGTPVDKLKIMGVELKKTVLPKPIAKKLSSFIERLLRGEDWDNDIARNVVDYKNELFKNPKHTLDLGLPKGIKKVEYYAQQYKIYGENTNLPGHVAAALFWNQCLERFNDKESISITSGMKISVFYLTQKFGKFKSIAIPVDLEVIPTWFNERFLELIDKDAQIKRLIDKPIDNIIKAIGKESPTEQSLYVDSLLEF